MRPDLRVLIIHTAYKFKGGEDTVVANELALLAANGVVVELLEFSNKGNTLLKVIGSVFNIRSYLATLAKIRSFRPDIVHIHNLHFGGSLSVLYAAKKLAIPAVMTLHNYRLLCPSATLFFDGSPFNDALRKAFSWKAVFKGVYQHSRILTFWMSLVMFLHQKVGTYKLVSKFIVLGANTKTIFLNSKLSALYPNMIVKPNFCYNTDQFDGSPGDHYLYIGRLSEEKGVKTLLRAFSQNKLPLKIAGTGPMTSEVISYSERYSNIKFMDSVNSAGVTELLHHAIALIFPSEWLETFGMVIIEAFSKSVPVIASDLGQLRTTIHHQVNGLHFQAGNAADLLATVNYYQGLPIEEKLRYRRNAFDSYQEKYTPEKNADELISIYQDMLNE